MGTARTMMRLALLCFAVVVAVAAFAYADDQKDALNDLYSKTSGDNWKRNDHWGSDADYCTWYGVQCKHDPPGTSQVITVALKNNGLKGMIPDSLAKMLSLKTLELENNQLTGTVPGYLASLPDLQMVHLAHNQLHGNLPATIMNLTEPYPAMQEIDLSYNQITGPIPETVFGPEKLGPWAPNDNLKVLNLRSNALTGDIPSRMTRADRMVSMLLGGNNMTGTIDDSLGSFLTSRKYCDLSGSVWTCPLPSGVADACQAICK